MFKIRVIWFVLLLAGCGEMTATDEAKMAALVACVEKAETVFPEISEIPDLPETEDGEASKIDIAPNGDFLFSAQHRRPEIAFACAGNSNRRQIDKIEFSGQTKKPTDGQNWSY